MVKLQKSNRQWWPSSQQPSGISSVKQGVSKASPIAPNQKHRALSCPPQLRQQISNSTDVAPIDGPAAPNNALQVTFSYSPRTPEPAFVAVGREQFLHRATMLAQAYARKFGSEGCTKSTKTDVPSVGVAPITNLSQGSRPFPITGTRRPSSSFPVLMESDNRRTFMPTDSPNENQSHAFSETKGKLQSAQLATPKQVARKRCQSLPVMVKRSTASSKGPRLSFSPLQAIQFFRARQHHHDHHQPPFTPKVDLEMVLDAIPIMHHQNRAEPRQQCDVLQKETSVNQRSVEREAGLLRKRRRGSSLTKIAQPLAIPYESVKLGTRPSLVRSLKGGLPSSNVYDSDTGSDKTFKTPIDKTDSTTDLGSSSTSLGASETSSIYGSAKSTIESPQKICQTCPHCGHEQSNGRASDVPNLVSGGTIADDNKNGSRSSSASGKLVLESSTAAQRSNSTPGTPVEVSIRERMQAARAIILAASKEGKSTNPQECFDARAMRSSSTDSLTTAIRPTSALEGFFREISKANPYHMEQPFEKTGPISPVQSSTGLPEVCCYQNSLHNAEYEQRADSGTHRNERGRSSPINGDNNFSMSSSMDLGTSRGQNQIEDIYFAKSSASLASTLTESRSHSISSASEDQSSFSTSLLKPSSISVASNDNYNCSSPVPSISPSRGILIVSSTIISNCPITDIHPALRDQSVESLKHLTTTSEAQSTLPTTNASRKPITSSSHLPRLSRRSSMLKGRRHEHSQSHVTSETKLTIKPELMTNTADNEAPPTPISARHGTQSLSQFQRNCKRIPQSMSPQILINVDTSIASTTTNELQSTNDMKPPLRRKPHIEDTIPSHNKLQKSRLDSDLKHHDRGRRHSRPSQPPISTRSSSMQGVATSINEIVSRPTTSGKENRSATGHEDHASSLQTQSPKTSPTFPPNSYTTPRCTAPSESRSSSRGRSRIRSMLGNIRLMSRDGFMHDQDDQTIASRDIRNQNSTDLDTFKSSGPYESIIDPKITAASSKSVSRRSKINEHSLKSRKTKVTV